MGPVGAMQSTKFVCLVLAVGGSKPHSLVASVCDPCVL